ncbi:MAG: hypothetical protein RIE24_16710 [Silicimonas sp.]|uniref:Transmembrane protein n=3 Tax=Roseovarius TaxID=74030 RepID=A0A0T5NPN9_9RHOB|nr:hypothetical protein [Roseovarius atlanticus]KRS10630.1 hypothetical protein XM53_20055 [Roseovarius atlanticus]
MVHIDENFVTRPLGRALDFKELFQAAISARAGLSPSRPGETSPEWTPSKLADAILEADPEGRGVDVRTVQNWFQDNDRGISSENIACLARVFGKGDPDAVAAWRTELRAANKRLASKRRARRGSDDVSVTSEDPNGIISTFGEDDRSQGRRGGLAELSERMFTNTEGFGVAVVVWAGFFLLCLMTFVFENHDITYAARPDLIKQVGFFWSLSWPVECLLLYPTSFLLIAHLVAFWKRACRATSNDEKQFSNWNELIISLRLPFWIVAFVSFGLVFLVQWSGVYLRGLTQSDRPGLIDWVLVARVRPDVVSFWEALVASLFAFSYSGLIYWFYFTGFLLLFAVCHDYNKRTTSSDPALSAGSSEFIGEKLQRGIFRCTVIGIFAATAIQLNAIYLKSDGSTSLSWLINDLAVAVDWRSAEWSFLDQSSVSSLTSSILLLFHVALYGICTTKVRSAVRATHMRNLGAERVVGNESSERRRMRHDTPLVQLCILGLLCFNFALLGRFVGFTLLLCASLLIAIVAICRPEKHPELQPSVEK